MIRPCLQCWSASVLNCCIVEHKVQRVPLDFLSQYLWDLTYQWLLLIIRRLKTHHVYHTYGKVDALDCAWECLDYRVFISAVFEIKNSLLNIYGFCEIFNDWNFMQVVNQTAHWITVIVYVDT